MIKNLKYITTKWWWERNWVSRFVYPLMEIITKITHRNTKITPKTLLIVRLDAIGDYVLFRNFLELLRKDPPYQDYHITLCGNSVWQSLAETYDKQWIDEFIWVDIVDFYYKSSYRFETLQKIAEKGYDVVLNSVAARSFHREDAIVNVVKANHKIGSHTRVWENMSSRKKKISDKYYTQLIPVEDYDDFEFLVNQKFFDKILQVAPSTRITKTHLPVAPNKQTLPANYATIAPSANAIIRRWDSKHFAQVADFLYENYQIQSVILGGKGDKPLADIIIATSKYPDQLIDLTGKTSVLDMVNIIGNSTILVANESGGTHIAVATNIPVVCISNGTTFGRFTPYPTFLAENNRTVYPQEIKELWHDKAQLIKLYASGSSLNINSITPEEVIEEVKFLLKNITQVEKHN